MMPLLMVFDKAGAQIKNKNNAVHVNGAAKKAKTKNAFLKPVKTTLGNEDVIVTTKKEYSLPSITTDMINQQAAHPIINTECALIGRVGGYIAYRVVEPIDTTPAFFKRVFHKSNFIISPNPAPRGGNVTIDVKKEGNYSIQLFDNSGKPILVNQFNAVKGQTQTSITIPSALAAGMYYIKLVDDKKKNYTDKIVVM